MSDREKQRKYYQDSTIKDSEYAKQNTNLTRQANPTDIDEAYQSSEKSSQSIWKNFFVQLISIGIGVAFFFLMMYVGDMVLPDRMYDSVYFLLVDLILSVIIVVSCSMYWKSRQMKR